MRHQPKFNFFNFTRYQFGYHVTNLFKSWIKFRKMYINSKLRSDFIRKCIAFNIVPPHAKFFAHFEKCFHSHRFSKKFFNLKNKFTQQVLKLQIGDACARARFASERCCEISRRIFDFVPVSVCNSFFSIQCFSMHSFYKSAHMKLEKKLNWLLKKSKKEEHIRPITYSCILPRDSKSEVKFKLDTLPYSDHVVTISPPSSVKQNDLTIRDNWFVNLSSISIPDNIQSLLQLGNNFSLPVRKLNNLTTDFIKNIENNIWKLPNEIRSNIREKSTSIINRLPSHSIPTHKNVKDLIELAHLTKTFLINNPDLILTRADKGNTTVALDKHKYIINIERLLCDTDTYSKVKKDPLRKITTQLRDLLNRWKSQNLISNENYKSLSCSDGILPRAYGLPKIHKPNHPFRIIVSSTNSPLHTFATALHKILHKSIPPAPSFVPNSFALTNKLKNVFIEENYTLISLDVISLFTNIPLDLAVESVSKRWDFISKTCSIPQNEFITAIKFVLHSSFFKFNNTVYQQTFGTPMGSPLSPIIADLVLQDLEEKALQSLDFPVLFYCRYVDDVVCSVPSDKIEQVLFSFNSIHPRLQFTIEKSLNNRLNFLDVTLIVNEGRIIFDLYHKPTSSGRYLNYLSQHPVCQKRGTIIGLIDKIILLSHPKFHAVNFKSMIKTLLNNNYPLSLIFRTISERLNTLFHRQKNLNTTKNNSEMPPVFFTVPYVSGLSERFRGIIRGLDVKMSFYSLNKLSHFIKTQKDPLDINMYKNVVYKIDCANCDASYVGQTGRQLGTRITEHKNHIKRKVSTRSVITEHRIEQGHEFKWGDIRVLDTEPHYHKRLTSEMLYIKRQNNSLNLQTDTEGLHHSYVSLINKLPHI